MAGSCIVAIESRKHAARRPSPPLPRPASGSCSSKPSQSRLFRPATSFTMIEQEVRDVVGKRAADEKLHRDVVDALGVRAACRSVPCAAIAGRGHRARSGPRPRTARAPPPSSARRCRRRGDGDRRARRTCPRTESDRIRSVREAADRVDVRRFRAVASAGVFISSSRWRLAVAAILLCSCAGSRRSPPRWRHFGESPCPRRWPAPGCRSSGRHRLVREPIVRRSSLASPSRQPPRRSLAGRVACAQRISSSADQGPVPDPHRGDSAVVSEHVQSARI